MTYFASEMLNELAKIFSDEASEIEAIKEIVGRYNDGYNLLIKVAGSQFHLSFPASFAESLNEIQRNFYRSVAFALHGEDNIRRLTSEELREYEITFTIREGCTEFLTNIIEKLAALAEKVMDGMDAKAKASFFLRLVLIFAFTALAWHGINQSASVLSASEAQQIEQIKEQEETKRLEAALNVKRGQLPAPQEVINHFEKSTEDSEQAVLKGAKYADSVIFRGKSFNREDIEEANQRASRAPKTSKILSGIYHIIIVNSRDSSVIRLTLSDKDGNDISAALDTLQFDAEQVESIWDAAQNRRPIQLDINVTLAGANIKHAYIAGINTASE
ncbi:hypothetical protein LVJ85_13080 [Neisseria sp. Dent CA1/247]|uniref:hypothetical protein n=1 Tax=Neisseria sp. Dent CA1/247 TaxID=2912675 RepID=UPI001FD41C05|nr:hypothetical protein [Neisseria sp. Dent CA1/247]UOO76905.1 hypothetical protein LVJ85_13080 [Neisseria sp. Dent CA1/247]